MIGSGISGDLLRSGIPEGFGAAFVVQFLALLDRVAHVQATRMRIEERKLAQPVFERREVEFDHGEGPRRRQERDLGAAGRSPRRRRRAAAASPSRNSMECCLPSRQIVSLRLDSA